MPRSACRIACVAHPPRANSKGISDRASATGRHLPADRGDRRAAVPASPAGWRARLPGGRRDHRTVGPRAHRRRPGNAALRRAGRRAAAVPRRARTRAVAPVGAAQAGVRPGRRAGSRVGHRPRGGRARPRARVATCDRRRLRPRDVVHGDRAGMARRARPAERARGTPDVRRAAVPGPGGDPADRAAAAAHARHRRSDERLDGRRERAWPPSPS